MIVLVTPNLASAMNRTAVALTAIEAPTKKISDKNSYPELAHQLEDLVVNLLSASSSLTLIGDQATGARFDMSPETKLATTTSECVLYLRNDATNLLRSGSLSPYERAHVDNVLNRIMSLYTLLRAAIIYQARCDLQRISDTNPLRLVSVAANVAQSAAQGPEAPGTKQSIS